MDPAPPAYNRPSVESQIADASGLILQIGQSFALAKVPLMGLSEALADPAAGVVTAFTDTQTAFIKLTVASRLSAGAAVNGIDTFTEMSMIILNDETINEKERTESLGELACSLGDDSKTALEEYKQASEELKKQAANLEKLLLNLEGLVEKQQKELSDFDNQVKELPAKPEPVDIFMKIKDVLLPWAKELIRRFKGSELSAGDSSERESLRVRPEANSGNSSRAEQFGHSHTTSSYYPTVAGQTSYGWERGWESVEGYGPNTRAPTSLTGRVCGAMSQKIPRPFGGKEWYDDYTGSNAKKREEEEIMAEYNKVVKRLKKVEAKHAKARGAIAQLISEISGVIGSLGDFSGVWNLLVIHAEELEDYVRKGGVRTSEELLTRIRSEIGIYGRIKESLVAYSLSA